ncbi:18.3 kDa v-ski oncogene-like, partial [Spodoptera frugiperda ascovirus 1a]
MTTENAGFACAVMKTAGEVVRVLYEENVALAGKIVKMEEQMNKSVNNERELETELAFVRNALKQERGRREKRLSATNAKKDEEIARLQEDVDYASNTINELNDQTRMLKQQLEIATERIARSRPSGVNASRSENNTDNDDWDYYDIVDESDDQIVQPMLR